MRREYGRSLRGHRPTGTRPFRSWKTISLIGAIRLGEKPKIMTSKTAVDGPTFLGRRHADIPVDLRERSVSVVVEDDFHEVEALRSVRGRPRVPLAGPDPSVRRSPRREAPRALGDAETPSKLSADRVPRVALR